MPEVSFFWRQICMVHWGLGPTSRPQPHPQLPKGPHEPTTQSTGTNWRCAWPLHPMGDDPTKTIITNRKMIVDSSLNYQLIIVWDAEIVRVWTMLCGGCSLEGAPRSSRSIFSCLQSFVRATYCCGYHLQVPVVCCWMLDLNELVFFLMCFIARKNIFQWEYPHLRYPVILCDSDPLLCFVMGGSFIICW